jgi:hypothetical protein
MLPVLIDRHGVECAASGAFLTTLEDLEDVLGMEAL